MNAVFTDIGNTSIVFFYVKEGKGIILRSYDKVMLKKNVEQILLDNKGDYLTLEVSSVNSLKLKELTNLLRDFHKANIEELDGMVLKDRVRELDYTIPNLDILGSDMLFDILGSEASTLICDYGTASKLMPVDKDKVFLGGMIGPGLSLMNSSLFHNTDLLGDYAVNLPPDYVNYSTEGAINASSTFGEAFKVKAMLDKTRNDTKDPCFKAVLTGGAGELVYQAMEKLKFTGMTYDPLLLFRGMSKATNIYADYFNGGVKK